MQRSKNSKKRLCRPKIKTLMGNAQCTGAYEYYNGECLSPCTPGTEVLTTDPTFCVATTPCQLNTTQDLVAPNVCNKTSFPASGGSCSTGFTQWLDGECFVNCSSLFVENGLTCIKRTYARDSVYPSCGALQTLDGSTCSLSVTGWFVIFISLFVFVLLCILLWRATQGPSRGQLY